MFDLILTTAGAIGAALLSIGFLITVREFRRLRPARVRDTSRRTSPAR